MLQREPPALGALEIGALLLALAMALCHCGGDAFVASSASSPVTPDAGDLEAAQSTFDAPLDVAATIDAPALDAGEHADVVDDNAWTMPDVDSGSVDVVHDAQTNAEAEAASPWCFYCSGIKLCSTQCIDCQGGRYCPP